MIYTYRYLEYPIEAFHENIVYFFERLFELNQSTAKLNQLLRSEFVPLVRASPKTLRKRLEAIVVAYCELKDEVKILVQEAFYSNNAVEDICDCGCKPIKYSDLPADFSDLIKDLFTALWEEYPQNQKIKDAFGTVKGHFDAFVDPAYQTAILCPFCGIRPLEPSGGLYRDAYDHFIPKAVYPFNAINFRNLVPICHVCNSNAKKAKDVPFDDSGIPRRTIYPYANANTYGDIKAHVVLRAGYEQLEQTLLRETKAMWYVSVTSSGSETPEMEAWDAIYDIRQRYQNHIGQYEREWWKHIAKEYRRQMRRCQNFNDFTEGMLESLGDDRTTPLAIIQRAYYKYLFAVPDVEMLLNSTIN